MSVLFLEAKIVDLTKISNNRRFDKLQCVDILDYNVAVKWNEQKLYTTVSRNIMLTTLGGGGRKATEGYIEYDIL